MRFLLLIATLLFFPSVTVPAYAEDALFSGPQVGEALPAFSVREVFGDDAGKEIDFVARADGKPLVLVFVHDVNRLSISFTRILTQYTVSRSADSLQTGVVWLRDDVTEAENELNRIRHALAPGAPIGISVNGAEGPGSYGLNRNVTLTVLVAHENKVTANFALVQPSLQADLPRVLATIVELVGGPLPSINELPGMETMRPSPPADEVTPNLRPLLQPLISKSASESAVDQAAGEIEKAISADPAARKELGRICSTIVDAGKLTNYGTPPAQRYLEKWAKEIGKPAAGVEPVRANR